MSSNYTENDVLKVTEQLISPERAHGRVSFFDNPTSLLDTMKGRVSDVLTSDPDTLFWFMGLNATKCVTIANSVLTETASIRDNLDNARTAPSFIDAGLLDDVYSGLLGLKTGTLSARKRKLQKLKAKASALIGSYTKDGASGVEKDAEVARTDIITSLSTITDALAELTELTTFFNEATTKYYDSGLFLSSIDTQADLSREALVPYMDRTGPNSADALVLIAASLGILDATSTVLDLNDPKYSDKVTVVDGTAASVTATKSMPVKTGATTIAVTSDGEAGSITVPASAAPVLTTVPQVGVVTGGGYYASVFPILAPAQLKILVDNTSYNLSIAAGPTSVADLRTKLNTAAGVAGAPVTVGGSGDTITFTYTGSRVGSSARIALHIDDEVIGGSDLHIICELDWDTYGEVVGSDTAFTSLSLTGYSASEPSLSLDKQVILEGYTTTSNLALSGGKTVIPLPSGHAVIAGDVVLLNGSYYQVESVTDTTATLTEEVLHVFDGSLRVDPTTAPATISVYRDYVTVTSPTTAWGTTSITAASNVLGFPTTTDTGYHDLVQLNGALKEGSPIRVGDAILDKDNLETKIGTVEGVSSAGIRIALEATTLTTDELHIESLGYNSYRTVGPSVVQVQADELDLPDMAILTRNTNVTALSGSSRELAETGLANIDAYANKVVSVFGGFSANTTRDGLSLINTLKESGLGVISDRLAVCDFSGIYDLTEQDLSELASVQNLLSSVISSLGESSVISHIGPEVPDSEYEPVS